MSQGRHLPYLGLENIEEARGLIFYGLETDQPLLVLRALRKVASLHARGEMRMPPRKPLNGEDETEGDGDKEPPKAR